MGKQECSLPSFPHLWHGSVAVGQPGFTSGAVAEPILGRGSVSAGFGARNLPGTASLGGRASALVLALGVAVRP
jgi:hypothetical protein